MAELNPQDAIHCGQSTPRSQGINSETVDLIATDPPFNKGVKGRYYPLQAQKEGQYGGGNAKTTAPVRSAKPG